MKEYKAFLLTDFFFVFYGNVHQALLAYPSELYCLFVKDDKTLTSKAMFSCKFNTQKHRGDVEKINNNTCLSLLITLFL